MVSDDILNEGIRLSELATERPWKHGYDCVPIGNTGDHDNLIYIEHKGKRFIDLWNPGLQDEKNLKYITHAATHFPAVARELIERRAKDFEHFNNERELKRHVSRVLTLEAELYDLRKAVLEAKP